MRILHPSLNQSSKNNFRRKKVGTLGCLTRLGQSVCRTAHAHTSQSQLYPNHLDPAESPCRKWKKKILVQKSKVRMLGCLDRLWITSRLTTQACGSAWKSWLFQSNSLRYQNCSKGQILVKSKVRMLESFIKPCNTLPRTASAHCTDRESWLRILHPSLNQSSKNNRKENFRRKKVGTAWVSHQTWPNSESNTTCSQQSKPVVSEPFGPR